MARPRPRFRGLNVKMIGAVLIGFALILGAFVYVQQGQKSYTVLIAQRAIPAGVALQNGDVLAVTVNGDAPAGNLIQNKDITPFYGRIAVNAIAAGDAVRSSDFFLAPIAPVPGASVDPNVPAPSGSYIYRFSELLQPDQRGIVVLGDPTTAFVRVGDYVDVLFVAPPTATDLLPTVARIMTKPDPAAGGGTGEPTGAAFVLAINEQEATGLVCAQQVGSLRVLLASPASVGKPSTTPTIDVSVLCTAGLVAPSPSASASTEPSPSDGGLPLPSNIVSPAPSGSVAP